MKPRSLSHATPAKEKQLTLATTANTMGPRTKSTFMSMSLRSFDSKSRRVRERGSLASEGEAETKRYKGKEGVRGTCEWHGDKGRRIRGFPLYIYWPTISASIPLHSSRRMRRGGRYAVATEPWPQADIDFFSKRKRLGETKRQLAIVRQNMTEHCCPPCSTSAGGCG